MTEAEKWALFDEFLRMLALYQKYNSLVSEGPTRENAGTKPKLTWEQWRTNPNRKVW